MGGSKPPEIYIKRTQQCTHPIYLYHHLPPTALCSNGGEARDHPWDTVFLLLHSVPVIIIKSYNMNKQKNDNTILFLILFFHSKEMTFLILLTPWTLSLSPYPEYVCCTPLSPGINSVIIRGVWNVTIMGGLEVLKRKNKKKKKKHPTPPSPFFLHPHILPYHQLQVINYQEN